MNPRYSIIIPHYNIPDLLIRCLKSIPVTEDIQVIVVDDHSPDADTYLERYPELSRPYLEFIRAPKNGGAGYVRNIGLDHAKGKWLLFADADDFYVDNMYDIITMYVESDADVIFFKKRTVKSDDPNCPTIRVNSNTIDSIMDHYLKTGDELPVRTRYWVPWGKMIKKSLIEKHRIRFEEIKYCEDVLFSIYVGCYAKKIEAIDMVLYVVTSREGSLTSEYGKKADDLIIKADVYFRSDVFLFRNGLCKERGVRYLLLRMINQDRGLFKHYFFKLNEIYPSKWSALRDISRNKSWRFKIKFYLYSLLVWTRVL